MDLTPYVAALRDDLAAAATAGDEATQRAAGSLAAALEPAVRLTLMNALSDFAAEVSDAVGDRSVDVRLRGQGGWPGHGGFGGHGWSGDRWSGKGWPGGEWSGWSGSGWSDHPRHPDTSTGPSTEPSGDAGPSGTGPAPGASNPGPTSGAPDPGDDDDPGDGVHGWVRG